MNRLRATEDELSQPRCPIYPDRPRAWWVGHAVAIAVIAGTNVLVALLDPHFPNVFFRMPMVLAIGVIGYLYGLGPFIVALVLGIGSYLYVQFPPRYAIWPIIATPPDLADFSGFTFGATAAGITLILIRRNRQRIQRLANDLAEKEAVLDAFFSQSPVTLAILDTDLRLFKVNPYTAGLLGRPAKQLEGRLMSEIAPDFEARFGPRLRRLLETGETENNVMMSGELPGEPGVTGHWLFSHFPISIENGKIIGLGMIGIDVTHSVRAEEALQEAQQHKLEFYRRTIVAATAGKLVITEHEDIEALGGITMKAWKVTDPSDLHSTRHEASTAALELGLDNIRASHYATAVGEAVTNAVKHAGGGAASIRKRDETLLFMISDKGPGIEALSLPAVALERGYTTTGTLGMGFKLMMDLSDRVYLATGPEGTTVGIEIGLQPKEDALLAPFIKVAELEE